MPANTVRLPDLWLKRELLFALLPPGKSTDRASGKVLAHCMRGDRGTVFNLARVMRGGALLGLDTDLYYLAATFEYLLEHGAEDLVGRSTIETYLDERGRQRPYLLDPLLGTYSDFAGAVLAHLRQRSDWSPARDVAAIAALGRALRRALQDEMEAATDAAGKLKMLWGSQRNWALSPDALERLIRQPEQDVPCIPEGDFVQILAAPAATDQWLFGFELRADDGAVVMPWCEAGGWFAPRLQRAGEPIALLNEYVRDEDNATATHPGRYLLQLVALPKPIGLNATPTLPAKLAQLLAGVPEWPVGYAEAMATVVHVGQMDELHVERLGRQAREEQFLEPLQGHGILVPERA
ncbi:hypothetical protein [Phenylobacterium sp.]|jgi:hypothetical protein|uniref:hypothetical protein n=1 Tax=Phenylobacterium sp. TaxID=1871053 RepID=UPI000C8B2FB6|nr:hypothetical protein [Phenylobacterium sp.]MAK82385.1 hypothetical protein [Phenylobacterium sp.]|tara:strand:- start:43 stop:1095 length:1053 start_codon:yes stop_codon:yes gene_type:complete